MGSWDIESDMTERQTQERRTLQILVEWIPMQDYGVIMRMCVLSHFSHVRLFMTLWTIARQAPLSMGFSRQEYWSGLPCPPPGDLTAPVIEPGSPAPRALQADSLLLSHRGNLFDSINKLLSFRCNSDIMALFLKS